ncbi:glycosyltransferase family 2 protein [Calycomorphotria hydatis]|uniref:Putative glycosyl transferase n=1 Tax=Calycomorphotria hydatis TaxID=2528027 RepID=A0A517TET9_9PLAN|nr:glycosyltransferase [Calycomorphotria hydatis]QDT66898.1 putative glycosyl transferase [Calycomorphotria hydatis]
MSRVSICLPHWQAIRFIQPCLRSIRKHSAGHDVEIIVVDNGSKDGSLDYLRSLDWIRLIERPDESPDNWPMNVFTAWDEGLKVATGDYYITMHSDVFLRRDGWLKPFLREIERGEKIAASGAWKLELVHPFYLWQKEVTNFLPSLIKKWRGRVRAIADIAGEYPRDYLAMYRTEVVRKHNLTFCCLYGDRGGGYSIARQLREAGYEMGMFPVSEMARYAVHVTHGSAGASIGAKELNHTRSQKAAERRVQAVLNSTWFRELEQAEEWDHSLSRAA